MITDDFYKSPFYRLLTFVTSNFKRIRNMRKLVKLIMLVFVILFVVFPCKAEGYGKYYQGLPFDIPKAVTPAIPELEVSLAEYGGIGNGMTLNTQAFAAAIADLSERGGGHLIVPEGIWLTGPIVLKSNIDLHVLKMQLFYLHLIKRNILYYHRMRALLEAVANLLSVLIMKVIFQLPVKVYLMVTENSGVRSSVLRLAMQNGIVL